MTDPKDFRWYLVCYIIAAVLMLAAFSVGYQSSTGANKVVGGDAYNYIIYAGRGIIWMVASLIFTVVGAGMHVADTLKRLSQKGQLT